jgi:hypothetical protein
VAILNPWRRNKNAKVFGAYYRKDFMLKLILLISILCNSTQTPAEIHDLCSHLLENRSWRDEVAPAWDEIKKSYHAGYQLRSLDIKKKRLLKEQRGLDQLLYIDQKIAEHEAVLTRLNDSFIERLHRLYSEDGIKSLVEVSKKGHKVIKLDFSLEQPPGTVPRSLNRIFNRYGLREITINLKENASRKSLGFFRPSELRIELGPQQGIRLLENYLTTTGIHEARHAMFNKYLDLGIDSLYHMSFIGSEKKLLNGKKMYDRFMSAEELYTFSTDLQKILNSMQGGDVDKLLPQLASKARGLKTVSATAMTVTDEMIFTLKNFMNEKSLFENIYVDDSLYGNFQLSFKDQYQRVAIIEIVSDFEKDLIKRHLELGVEYNVKLQERLDEVLEKPVFKGIAERYPGQMTDNDKVIISHLKRKIRASPEMVNFAREANLTTGPMFDFIQAKFELYRGLAQKQSNDVGILLKKIDDYQSMTDQAKEEAFLEIKKLVSKIEKRVKESYKNFGQ